MKKKLFDLIWTQLSVSVIGYELTVGLYVDLFVPLPKKNKIIVTVLIYNRFLRYLPNEEMYLTQEPVGWRGMPRFV